MASYFVLTALSTRTCLTTQLVGGLCPVPHAKCIGVSVGLPEAVAAHTAGC